MGDTSMYEKWSDIELEILINNISKTKNEIAEILDERGYQRTLEAIKTKKKWLRDKGEVPAYGEASDRVAGSCAGEITSSDGKTYDCVGDTGMDSEGFFPGTAKRDIYSSYKDMVTELVAEARAGAAVVGSASGDGVGDDDDAESLVVVLSDHHVGKTIKNCEGEEIYNIPIAVDRIRQIGESIARVISHAQKGANINEIVVTLVGDMCEGSGDIYKTQAHALDDHVAGQLKAATKALWNLIVKLSNIEGIKNVRVVSCRGNHGRISDSAHEDSNIDNLLYDNLQLAAEIYGDPKISVETKYSEYHLTSIRGHKVLLRHEAPITCDTPAARAKLGGWFSMTSAKVLISGHFHHTQMSTFEDKYVFRNASLCGPDSLSQRMGVFSNCEQIVFGMSAKRMITFVYPVTLS